MQTLYKQDAMNEWGSIAVDLLHGSSTYTRLCNDMADNKAYLKASARSFDTLREG
jgi:enoyl-[acyl-carrier protein] reductase I